MFPLYSTTWILIVCLSVAACVAGFVARRGLQRRKLWVLALALGALWPLSIAIITDFYIYAVQAAMIASAGSVAILVVSGLAGLLLRRFLPAAAALAVALSPVWLAIPVVLELQRVPNAPCADRALFTLADITLSVPRTMSARAVTPPGATPADWQGSYSDWPGNKPQVRAYCHATEGGTEALALPHLWLAASDYKNHLRDRCAAGDDTGLCNIAAESALTVIQFYPGIPPRPEPSLGHFSQSILLDAMDAGRTEGIRCPEPNGRGERYCTIWTSLRPDLLAVASLRTSATKTEDQLQADSRALIQGLITWLEP